MARIQSRAMTRKAFYDAIYGPIEGQPSAVLFQVNGLWVARENGELPSHVGAELRALIERLNQVPSD